MTDHQTPAVRLDRETRDRMARYSVAVKHYPCYRCRTRQMHSVDALLISFIVHGRGEHVMGETVFPESGGSIGITYYGERHTIVTSEEGMEIYNLFLDPQTSTLPVLPAQLNDTLHLLLPQHHGFRNRLNRAIHLSVPNPATLAAIAGLMAEESQSGRAGAEEVVMDCLRTFLIHCCRAAQDDGIQTSHAADMPFWVTQLTGFIDGAFSEQLSLENLADQVGLSPGYLCQAFKRHTGKTPFQYLIDRRIQAAMLRLRTTDQKVLSIALDCGFNDLTYFNRTFKRLAGCSPTAWRGQSRSH